MAKLDDWVVLARRGELPRKQVEMLRQAQQSNPDVALAMNMAQYFEAEGQPQPSDELDHLRLLEGVMRGLPSHVLDRREGGSVAEESDEVRSEEGRYRSVSSSEIRLSRSRRKLRTWLVAAAPLLAAGAAAAAGYGGYRWYAESVDKPVGGLSTEGAAGMTDAEAVEIADKPAKVQISRPAEALSEPVGAQLEPRALVPGSVFPQEVFPQEVFPQEVFPQEVAAPSASPIRAPRKAVRRRVAKRDFDGVLPQKELPSRRVVSAPSASVASPRQDRPISKPSRPRIIASAAQLLFRAQVMRRSDWGQAVKQYQHLVEVYPRSIQAGIAEMALAKREVSEGNLYEARRWFRRHQQRHDSPLRAEAHWGDVTTSRGLKDTVALRRALATVLRIFPNSSYGQAAREELSALGPGEFQFAQ